MGLLLHSLSEFAPFLLGLLDRCNPASVLEIGSESGGFSRTLFANCTARGGELVTIEPTPAPAVLELAKSSASFHLYAGTSLGYFTEHGCAPSFVIIDGDHNWFTVHAELTLVAKAWRESKTSGVIVLHDVGWPWGRRDMYYEPKALPPQAVRPHTYDHGVVPGDRGVVPSGFRGEGGWAAARVEGGPCNGVRTAIEDFMVDVPGWKLRTIDAVFGLGVLTMEGTREDAIVAELIAPYQNPLMGALERNRCELYTRVIALQDEIARLKSELATRGPGSSSAGALVRPEMGVTAP